MERGKYFAHVHVQIRSKTRGRVGYHTFTQVSVSRRINALAATFNIRFPSKWIKNNRDEFDFVVGKQARVYLSHGGRSDQVLLNGFVEKVNTGVDDTSHQIEVSGRDNTADLIDCSPNNLPEFNNRTLFQIMQDVCRPFNIPVAGENVDKDFVFPRAKLNPGKTVFAFLNDLAKQRGLLLCNIPRVGGGIVLCRPGDRRYNKAKIDANNVLRMTVNQNASQIFSEYNALTQSVPTPDNPDASTDSEGTVKDNTVGRYRPMTFIVEKTSNVTQALTRAKWEATRRVASLLRISCDVIGWINDDQDIWRENMIVNVDYPSIGIKGNYLIESVTYAFGANDAQKTSLVLVPKDAYQIEPTIIDPTIETNPESQFDFGWTRQDFIKDLKNNNIDYRPHVKPVNKGAEID